MRLLVCAAASMLLLAADALALDDTPIQPTYAWPREAVRAVAPAKHAPIVAVDVAIAGGLPAKKRVPPVALAQEKIAPPPCRVLPCAPESPLRSSKGATP